jgi:uncharacterized protein YigA (DUF484 family)
MSEQAVSNVSEDDVVAWLKEHPGFLTRHPELVASGGPVRPDGAIDMQHMMLQRMRADIEKLRSVKEELVSAGRANQIVQNRIHVAVLSIIGAGSFERLIHTVTHELPGLLDVDFITLALEATEDAPRRAPIRGVFVLAPGAIDQALGRGQAARLRADIFGEEAFFGAGARSVKSDVLIRLTVSSNSPDGVLCFGSRDPQSFGPHQSVELLMFLARVLENTFRAWLDLPE